jgi:2,4-didehydro-3-deoxy-L-rhamnonate hydrolase
MQFALATVREPMGPVAYALIGDRLHRISDIEPSLSGLSCLDLVRDWGHFFDVLTNAVDRYEAAAGLSIECAPLLTPIMYPDKLLAVGANYSGHLKEMGLLAQRWDSMPFFMRPPETSLVGPGKTVVIPRSTKQFDWECELAVVVSRRLKHASPDQAGRSIAGYSIGLDLSCRDLIQVDNDLKVDLMRGKAQDTMAPCGPVMMPAAFLPEVDNLRIRLWVNEELMIDASTSEMLYKIDQQLSIISEYITLEPGDILFTGSPSGSAGVHGNRWLNSGDVIRADIEKIGTIEVVVSALEDSQ